MDFKFPINKKDNTSYTTEELFDLLAKETTGHYLLGNHNFWHGGIHFTNASASQCVKDEPVRCIADGEVIAYRINDSYLKSIYTNPVVNNQPCKPEDTLTLLYSNAFCLVKHEYQSAAKEPPKAADTAENWDDRYFVLTEGRNVRNENTAENTKCIFTGLLPVNTRIKILKVFDPVAKSSTAIAKVSIISIPATNKSIANSNPNAQGNDKLITQTEGDEVYMVAFTKDKQIITLNSKAKLLTEYTPIETLLNKTFKLNTETPAKINKTNYGQVGIDKMNAALEIKNILSNISTSTNNSTPTPTAIPENKYVLTYETTLPKDMQVQLLTCQGTTANVKITRPVKAKLTTANSTAAKEIELAAGEIVTITLFKSDNETIETYTIPAQGKTPAATAPIAEQTTSAESWNDQMIILEKDTKASQELEGVPNIFFQLPAGTKLQIVNTNKPTIESNYTEAKLLHDIKVHILGNKQAIIEGDTLKVDLFDYHDNLKQPVTKTDDPAPLKNTLTFYSLYMHLQAASEYKESQQFPYYWQGKMTAKVTTELQTYTNGTTKVKGAVMSGSAVFEYDPAITDTLQTTNATTKKTETLSLTKCTYKKSGTFKGRINLKPEDIFWAVIDSKTSKTTKVIPNNPDDVNCYTPPLPIKAGDPIGYLGTYQTPKLIPKKVPIPIPTTPEAINNFASEKPQMEISDKQQLHLEIFVTDQRELENFIKNKVKLNTGKKYLKLYASANLITNKEIITGKKVKPPTQPITQSQQPTESQPIKTNFIVLQKDHIFELDKLKTIKDDKAQLWYEIPITRNDKEITGYIKENAIRTKIITQHDWEELGFAIVKENGSNSDGFLDKDDMTPFFKDLYMQLDTSGDKKVDRDELQRTLTDTNLRNRWSKLIGYHPTEWQASSSCTAKWSRLDTLLKNNQELLRHEKERIDKLIFWDKVPEIANTPQVCHIHPAAFFDNIIEENYHYRVDKEGFIQEADIIKSQIVKLERGNISGPNAIILHRTYSKGSAENVINYWKGSANPDNIGAHFVISKDGTIHQVVSLKKYANHVGRIRPRCARTNTCPTNYATKSKLELHQAETKRNYPERYPYNNDCVGIEVVAWWTSTDGWDPATNEQLKSIKKLVKILQKEFNLNDEDLYQHQCIAYKTSGEGKDLYPPADNNGNIDPEYY